MPEGDAVRRTGMRLDRALAGRVLTSSDFRVPAYATVDLDGATVVGTVTQGKHLLTRIEPVEGPPLTLHTHLKMEGSWRVVKPGQRWSGPAHEARVVLTTAESQAIGFRLGVVELIPTADEHTVVGHLGPDFLGPWTEADEQEALARLTARPDRRVGDALLDQTVAAGAGTIWTAETCFVNGVNPMAPVSSVRDPLRLLRRTRQMLQAAVPRADPITTGDRRNPLWVFRRQRKSCLRCGTPIQAGSLGEAGRERTTYWCPHCQPMP